MFKENLILVCTEAQGLIPPKEIKRKTNKQPNKMIFKTDKKMGFDSF